MKQKLKWWRSSKRIRKRARKIRKKKQHLQRKLQKKQIKKIRCQNLSKNE